MKENRREKLISVIVPAYNVEKYLEYCINTICNQTYENMEILIVNDGSTDRTGEIIKELEKKDNRIKHILHEKNKGLYQARITGVEASKGDYIAFVDADDSVSVDWFRLLLKKAEETQSDIVLGNTICKNEQKEYFVFNTSYFMTRKKVSLCDGEILDYLMEDEGMCFSMHTVWNKLYSRALWNKSLPQLKKIQQHLIMTEDIAFSVVLLRYAKKLTYSNHDGYFYYRNSDSSTIATSGLNKIRKNVADLKQVFSFVSEFLRKEGLWDKYKGKYTNWKNRYFRWWSYPVEMNTSEKTGEALAIRKDFLAFFEKEKFENAVEEDDFFTDVSTTWNDKYEQIKKQIKDENIEYVSFDIFDTLVVRPLLEPTDLYLFMEDEFRKYYNGSLSFMDVRLGAEKQCRRRMHEVNPNIQDVTLDEIYEQMVREYKFSEDACKTMKEKEEELEIFFCTERKCGKELYELAHDVGKKIILISDMYLQEDCINAILKKNGYTLHEKLFLSSSERYLKYSGDLYRIALKECNIKPETMVHIGDNWTVDYEQPPKLGCKSCFLPKAKDILFNTLGDSYTGQAVGATFDNTGAVIDKSVIMKNPMVRCLYALVANKIYDNPFVSFNPVSNYNRDAYFIGYYAVGMHMLGMNRWMAEELHKGGYKKIHFIARDGYLPKKVYDLVRKYEKDLPESNYVYASRKSMVAATIRSSFDFYNIKNNCSIYGQTPTSIYKVYADVLKPLDEEMMQLLKKKGIMMDRKFANEESFKFFIDQLVEFAYDEQKAEENLKCCGDYFRDEIGEGDVTFDLGYSGKLQSALCTALGFPVDVFFLHSNGFEAAQQAKQHGYKIKSYYDFSTPMSGIVNEFIFSDYNPSCIGYKYEKGNAVPVFEERIIPYQEKFILDEIAKGCEDFVVDFYETFHNWLYMFEFRTMDTSLAYERFLINSKWFDINLLKYCYLEDEYYGGISKRRLSDHWWWQLNDRHVLMQQQIQYVQVPVPAEEAATMEQYIGTPVELQQMYQDGLFMAFYRKMNKKFPLGSKRRERMRKFAGKFMK